MRPQQLALPSRQTFLHHSCRRITPQSRFRVAHLSTTVVLQCPSRRIVIQSRISLTFSRSEPMMISSQEVEGSIPTKVGCHCPQNPAERRGFGVLSWFNFPGLCVLADSLDPFRGRSVTCVYSSKILM